MKHISTQVYMFWFRDDVWGLQKMIGIVWGVIIQQTKTHDGGEDAGHTRCCSPGWPTHGQNTSFSMWVYVAIVEIIFLCITCKLVFYDKNYFFALQPYCNYQAQFLRFLFLIKIILYNSSIQNEALPCSLASCFASASTCSSPHLLHHSICSCLPTHHLCSAPATAASNPLLLPCSTSFALCLPAKPSFLGGGHTHTPGTSSTTNNKQLILVIQ